MSFDRLNRIMSADYPIHDVCNQAMLNTVGWLVKTRNISFDEAKARLIQAMNSPLQFDLPTMDELDAMPDDDIDPESMICRTCGITMVCWDDDGVLTADPAIDCGGHCFGCVLKAEGFG